MKNNQFRFPLLFLAGLLSFLVSCDVIKKENIEPITSKVQDDTSKTKQVQKRVLIEYFTGHKCGNCPQSGGTSLNDLKRLYGSRAVFISVHAGFFANPSINPPKYNYDFRTTSGTALANKYSLSSTPQGLVNRKEYDNSFLLSPTAWASAVQSELLEKVFFEIQLKTTFNTSSKTLTIESEITSQEAIIEPHQLDFYITEDSVVNWQTDYNATPQDIENYEHKYVLRAGVALSEPNINTSPLAQFSKVSRSGSIAWKTDWSIKNAYVVAVISHKNTGVLIDVAEFKID
jgi:hypothetical protein